MSASRIPLQVLIKNNASRDFEALVGYDPEYGLDRSGSINIELKTKGGSEVFQVVLVDRVFRSSKKPLLPSRPAIINLNVDAVFAIVQRCRMRWEEALADAREAFPTVDGSTPLAKYLFEENCQYPVDANTFDAVARKLALAGTRLFEAIFESNRGSELDKIATKLREVARTGERILTVNAADFHIPWRLLYTHPDKSEPLAEDGSNFDPRGFWGYQHVVEQFVNDSYPLEYHLVAKSKLGFGAALHEKIDTELHVECLKRHHDFVQSKGEQLSYAEWTRKKDVLEGLRQPSNLQVIYFLCHAEGAGTTSKPNLSSPILEVTDGSIDAVDLRESINHKFSGNPPLVFINACRSAHLGTTICHNFTFASEFLEHGAACLVAPEIEVPAVFAGEFGKRFFDRLMVEEMPPPFAGMVLRDLTRAMWHQRNPLGLVYSLYAGADCHIRWVEA